MNAVGNYKRMIPILGNHDCQVYHAVEWRLAVGYQGQDRPLSQYYLKAELRGQSMVEPIDRLVHRLFMTDYSGFLVQLTHRLGKIRLPCLPVARCTSRQF